MGVSLSKGGKVSLAKVAANAGISNLRNITVGLGWDVNKYDGGQEFDLDASAFLCGANGKVRSEADFIFYGRTSDKGWLDDRGVWQVDEMNSSIIHTGDNRTGQGDGDDESILIKLDMMEPGVEKIGISVTIYEAVKRGQNFGMVSNAYVRIMDSDTGVELLRYDLGEDFSMETAIVTAEIYRHNGEWKFNAVGAGWKGGLLALCQNYGIDATE